MKFVTGYVLFKSANYLNTLRPTRNRQQFNYSILIRIFFNESVWISIKISLKFVRKGPTNNIAALVQIIAWRRPGDKLLFEPVMVSLSTHRPQWIYNAYLQTVAYWNVCYVYVSNIVFSKWRLVHLISPSSLRCLSAPSHQPGHFVKKNNRVMQSRDCLLGSG